jgi:type II secretion system protein N
LYGIYFIAACMVSALWLFPGEQVARLVSERLSGAVPGVTVKADRVRPALPFRVSVLGAGIIFDNGTHIRPQKVSLSVRPDMLFRRQKKTGFELEFKKGSIKGHVLSSGLLTMPFSRVSAIFEGLEINSFSYRNQLADIDLSFRADGRMVFPGRTEDENASGLFVFSNVKTFIEHPVFRQMGIEQLDFNHVEMNFSMDSSKMVIQKCVARGPVMAMEFTGTITPENRFGSGPVSACDVRLNGYFQPDASYVKRFADVPALVMLFKDTHEKGIPFRVDGTLGRPEIDL